MSDIRDQPPVERGLTDRLLHRAVAAEERAEVAEARAERADRAAVEWMEECARAKGRAETERETHLQRAEEWAAAERVFLVAEARAEKLEEALRAYLHEDEPTDAGPRRCECRACERARGALAEATSPASTGRGNVSTEGAEHRQVCPDCSEGLVVGKSGPALTWGPCPTCASPPPETSDDGDAAPAPEGSRVTRSGQVGAASPLPFDPWAHCRAAVARWWLRRPLTAKQWAEDISAAIAADEIAARERGLMFVPLIPPVECTCGESREAGATMTDDDPEAHAPGCPAGRAS
jgi:hypothetical protein